MSQFAFLLLLWFNHCVCFLDNTSNVNFFIKEWKMSKALSINNYAQIGGYDIYSELFYISSGFGNDMILNDDEYTYNPINGESNFNESVAGRYIVDGQSQSTIYSNSSTFIYYTVAAQYHSNNFYLFDIQNNQFTQIGKKYPKPNSTAFECIASDNIQYIYIMGGTNPMEQTSFWTFDIQQNEWIIGPSMNIPRYLASCIYVDKQLFIFGGAFQSLPVETIDLSSPNNEWKLIAPINSTTFNEYPYYYNAFYPAMNVITKDNWRSNTVFIFGGHPGITNICITFNFRTYVSTECDILPDVMTWKVLSIYAYIQNEYRYYLFGGLDSLNTDTATVQYAVLDYNQTQIL